MPEWSELEVTLPRVVRNGPEGAKGQVAYVAPPWAEFDPKEALDSRFEGYSLDVISNGTLLESVVLKEKPFYVLGSMDDSELVYKNPLVSRRHVVFQLTRHGGLLLFDLKSTHGTTVNHEKVEPETYYLLKTGDQVRIGKRGSTSRTYVVCGPDDGGTEQEETEEGPRPAKIAKKRRAEDDEKEIMAAVEKATAADYYDTNLYFDEWDNYFDRTETKAVKTEKREQKTHTAASLKSGLRKLYQEEVELLNRWYRVLASAIESGIVGQGPRLSKTDSQLKRIQLKGYNEDRDKLQKQLDSVRADICKHKRLLKLTMC